MKKIICPTDFTSAADNAAEFAAKHARTIDAEVKLIHVELTSVMEALPVNEMVNGFQQDSEILMKKNCEKLNSTYDISCTYETELSTTSLSKVMSERSKDCDLIVMGTNGVDDVYQYFFGSNSFNVAERAHCPVLIIPENVPYSPILQVVFAWDYNKKSKISLKELGHIFELFDAEIILLHVSKKREDEVNDHFKELMEEVNSNLGDWSKLKFKRLIAEDTAERIDEYMSDTKSDVLAITHYDRGYFGNMFHGKTTKELTELASYPLLILHV